MSPIKIVVGSKNPVKVAAAKEAFVRAFKAKSERLASAKKVSSDDDSPAPTEESIEIIARGVSVPSGVSDQPMGDKETRTGAQNRALNALQTLSKEELSTFSYAVGMEGGLNRNDWDDQLSCQAWMAVIDIKAYLAHQQKQEKEEANNDWIALAQTAAFPLPKVLKHLVLEKGLELGHADDLLFKRENSKHGEGTVGILSHGALDRTDYYVHALILCLCPLLHRSYQLTPNDVVEKN
eukprot:g224.t1